MRNLNTLDDVFIEQIEDLHSAERQLIAALPKMASAADNAELREALQHHLEETRGHLERLKEIVSSRGLDTPTEQCEAMKGLVKEGDELITAEGEPTAKDAALIAAAQRVEHYEIAAYGTARTLADQLGYAQERDLLDKTLDEESAADKLLTKIATGGHFGSGVNEAATS